MTLDIQAAVRTLQQALVLLNEVDAATAAQQDEFIAQMYTTTHLLFSHPIIGAVTAEVIDEFNQNHADARVMVWSAATEGRRLASVLHDNLKTLGSRVSQIEQQDARVELTLSLATMSIAKYNIPSGESVNVFQLFQRMSEETFTGDGNTLWAVKNAIDTVKHSLTGARDWLELEDKRICSVIMNALDDFQIQIQKTQHTAESLHTFTEALSLRNATTRLRSFDQWVSSVIRRVSSPPNSNFEIPDKDALKSRLLLPLKVLSARVLEKLAAEVPIVHVLRRMKVHFEYFAREETVKEVKDASRLEDKLQLKMDRFLFDNGVFPITHIHVASGIADTVFSEDAPKLNVANENAIPPVLIELKQALSFKANDKIKDVDVRSKINEGRLQARIYADHMATNVKWSRPRVHVVVFYNGPYRYHVDAPDTILVYLGERLPSQGSIVLNMDSRTT